MSTNQRSGECSIHGSWDDYCYSCLKQADCGGVIEALSLYNPRDNMNRIAELEAKLSAAEKDREMYFSQRQEANRRNEGLVAELDAAMLEITRLTEDL